MIAVSFTQSVNPDRNQSEKKALYIPINLGFFDHKGDEITPESSSLLEFKTDEQTFEFENMPENSVPSIFRQFSAPVKIETDYSDDELAFLMAHDTDDFNRWDAAQSLFIKEIKKLISAFQQAPQELSVSPSLIDAFKIALTDNQTDRSFLAKTLSLPLESEIKDHFELINVEAIHETRKYLKQHIAKKLKEQFLKIVDLCSHADPFSISYEARSDRSLKNLCLSYLGALNEQDTTDLIMNHYKKAKNMTDELACFKILSEIDTGNKQFAVDLFYSKWKHDKLVLDKWFMVQAGSSLPDTLSIVKRLIKHKDFSIKNPNKVRSLIGMFSMQNHFSFHHESGEGYVFVADQLLILDSVNPQIAGRLSSCFNHWKKYDNKRKSLMKKELERIISKQNLSRNTYEIVSHALD